VERRFACTQCGQCCNRPPELELGEAAALADTFVLRLMLRIYSLPRALSDFVSELPREQTSAEFYESKRLLSSFAATSWPAKVQRGARIVDYVQYLSLSVLPLDLGIGTCAALSGQSCAIYARRPLSCRSVPLHYSRPAAAAVRDLDVFTATSGYRCETGADAPLVIVDGHIADQAMLTARAAAATRAQADQRWKTAIVKAMKSGQHGLPSLRDVEAHAAIGALTASMLGAWRIGLDGAGELESLLAAQCQRIEQDLQREALSATTTQTLSEMLREYRSALATCR
jgi:Fe-S-cluster containining protein